jgi:ribonuclease HIII
MEPSGNQEKSKPTGGVAVARHPHKTSHPKARPGTPPRNKPRRFKHRTPDKASIPPNPPKVQAEKNKIGEKTQPVTKPVIDTGWIGTDESGKGDYFGPLVIGGVHVDSKTKDLLLNLKVRDSKKISDNVIKDLDYRIRSTCIYSVVVIGPEKYNLLYQKMKNLNSLLAWGHARVIENLLLRVECKKAISDQFGSEQYIKSALMEMGKKIELVQMPGAEVDLGVAAASIVARAEFLRRMEKLSQECGFPLPKGASEQVDSAARKIVEQMGKEALNRFTKLHFKNTLRVTKVENPELSQESNS